MTTDAHPSAAGAAGPTVPALTLALLAAACGGPDAASAVLRTDSAGVEIVTNAGTDRTLPWRFTPTTRIGGADTGAAAFWEVSAAAVAADTDGRILVLDRQNFRVAAFDREGQTLWTAGGEGGGPGEFSFPFEVRVFGDTVRVTDLGGPEFESFHAADGRYLGSERLTGFAGTRIPTRFGTLTDYSEAAEGGGLTRSLGFLRGADTIVIATLPAAGPPRELVFPNCGIRLRIGPILSPTLVWDADFDRIFVATSAFYEIAVFRDSTLVTSIRRDVPPAETTPELIDAEFPDGFRVGTTAGLECSMSGSDAAAQLGSAPVVPTVRNLTIAPDRTLWVRRSPMRQSFGTFDLFDESGTYLGTLTDVPAPAAFLPNGDVIGVEQDEMDVERVVVYEVSVGRGRREEGGD